MQGWGRIHEVSLAAILGSVLAVSSGCGDGQGREVTGSSLGLGTDGEDESGGAEESAETGIAEDTDDPDETCTEACADDETCVAGACCPNTSLCGDTCCMGAEVCSFSSCVVPGDECVDATECPDDFYCEYALGEPGDEGDQGACQGGLSLATGKCLPKPPACPDGVEPDPEAPHCLPACEWIPESSFAPELKFAWDGSDIMMPPIVIQLDDDNCDGVVNERDIPEIVVATFEGGQYNGNGTLRAFSVMDGEIVEKWAATPAVDPIWPGRGIAGGNIDGVAGNEIVVCTTTGKVRAFAADGSERWTSDVIGTCDMPSIADLDQDGVPEIITETAVLDGATGTLKATIPAVGASWWMEKVIAADVTGDGMLDLVTPSRILDAGGNTIVSGVPQGTFPAVADFDLDGQPEIVSIQNFNGGDVHHLVVWRYAPNDPAGYEIVRQGIDINGPLPKSICGPGSAGNHGGGGPPTIADFNGDGVPDVGVAGGIGYAVFDGALLMNPQVANADTMMWIEQSQDCSSAFTGSTVFDFDGDGTAEVVYGDEQYLRIYRGSDGEVLFQTCNTTGTLHEYPVIADVDNDGHADIVVISNSYSSIVCPDGDIKTRGLRIFGDEEGRWVRTRRVWNQHAYHVTNIEEDGTIPAVETPNWTVPRLNNFRQNVQPLGEFSAPDLVGTVHVQCIPDYGLIAQIRNLGQAAAPHGVPVGFYAGDPDAGGTLLGTLHTTKLLYPAESENLVLMLENPPPALRNGEVDIFIVIDDGGGSHAGHECRVDNNKASGSGYCPVAG
jgi:hypothetical protein